VISDAHVCNKNVFIKKLISRKSCNALGCFKIFLGVSKISKNRPKSYSLYLMLSVLFNFTMTLVT